MADVVRDETCGQDVSKCQFKKSIRKQTSEQKFSMEK